MSTVIFDGQGNMPELNRITAKKNYASSSQSHKMGATAMFNDILHYLAKEKYPSLLNEVGGNVAVRQHPVYAFEKIKIEGKENQYRRKFIGLFTVGPDKGDKGFFGFTNEAVKNKAIRLEGTDHLRGVGFNYPWEVNGVKNIRYNADKEALCIVTGSDATNWTAIFEQSYCGNKKTEADIEAYLEEKYKPAYEVAYYNNPLIVGVDKTIEEINSDIEAFGKLRRTSDDRQYSFCEFWIDGEYDIYYLNQERNIYEKNGINILTDLGISEDDIAGLSIDEKNELFIQKRVERFKEECPKKFHKEDAIFQLMILFIMLASDNFEKNMYPYIMDLLWRFFQDDLDSIFSTDNQAQDTKKYSAELHDFTDDTHSAYVFKGEDSAFWQLIELAYPAECKKMGYDILQAMYDMASRGTTTTEKLMAFFEDYFFNRAQDYFTPSAYNNDTEYSYEEAWNNKEYVASVDIHPLAQALGGHEVTERAFLEKRIIFLMSKFGFGGFSSATDTALGLISFRTQTSQSFTLTPAIDMYPAILAGQAGIAASDHRIMAGESVTLYPGAGGNTNTYIVGADWLSDIGDLKDFQIDPSSNVALTIGSKRLRRIKVGDENPEEVTSNLTTLNVQQCDSLESIDARNLKYLGGNEEENIQGGITIDLTKCPRLIEALFGGTNVKEISIAPGSKIEKLQLPDNITVIDLRNTKFLEDIEIGNLANVRFLRIEDVPALNGFAVLKEAYNSDGQQLKDIRLLNFSHDGDANDITMLANIASDKDKYNNSHSYNGIDPDGTPNSKNPDLQGTLSISGGVYEDEINKVESLFKGLSIKYDPTKIYMRFADDEVLRVLLANMSRLPEGAMGITTEQAAAVTSIGTWFNNNDTIVSFNEFDKFNGISTIVAGAFYGCDLLESITLPNSVTQINDETWLGGVSSGAFNNCIALKSVGLSSNLTKIGAAAFRGCSALIDISLPTTLNIIGGQAFYNCSNLVIDGLNSDNITSIGQYAFRNTKLQGVLNVTSLATIGAAAFRSSEIEEVRSLGNITTTGNSSNTSVGGVFQDCTKLTTVVLPNSLKDIDSWCFLNCTSLSQVTLPANVEVIRGSAFSGCTSLSSIELPSSITSISDGAFYEVPCEFVVNLPNLTSFSHGQYSYGAFAYSGIKSIVSLGNITELGDGNNYKYGIFSDCKNLADVVLPDTLTIIGSYAFHGCDKLNAVVIPIGIQKIGGGAFYACTSLEIEGLSLPNLTSLGQNAFYGVKIKKLVLGSDGVALTLPNGSSSTQNYGDKSVLEEVELHGVTSIPANSFLGYTNLTVNNLISNEITSVGGSAFHKTKLKGEINLPSLTGVITSYTFGLTQVEKVTNLGSITGLTNSTTSSGAPFGECVNLKFVILPETLTMIGGYIFYGCSNLETIVCRAVEPPTVYSTSIPTQTIIYVPDASVEAYKEASGWVDYADRIKSIIEYAEIGILDKNNKVWSVGEWSGDSSDVVGIAMRGAAEFVIAKDEHTSTFGSGTTGELEGNGRVLTDYLIKNWGNNSVAASYCNSYMFMNGQNGYLPSQNEMVYILTHFDAVNEALSLVGGTLLVSDSAYWGANCNGNDSFCAMKTSSAVSKINQQKTFSRKMRILTELPEGLEW